MTRINSNIKVEYLTDEHLLAEHREIKRLPAFYVRAKSSGALNRIPEEFCLGTGHVTFFLDKFNFTWKRYLQIHEECKKRNFNVENYIQNWNLVEDRKYWKDYIPTEVEKEKLVERISKRIQESSKNCFHYKGKGILKEEAINILNGN